MRPVKSAKRDRPCFIGIFGCVLCVSIAECNDVFVVVYSSLLAYSFSLTFSCNLHTIASSSCPHRLNSGVVFDMSAVFMCTCMHMTDMSLCRFVLLGKSVPATAEYNHNNNCLISLHHETSRDSPRHTIGRRPVHFPSGEQLHRHRLVVHVGQALHARHFFRHIGGRSTGRLVCVVVLLLIMFWCYEFCLFFSAL